VESVIVLGADRVGKSTTVEETCKLLSSAGYRHKVLHFSGIRPDHHSPVEQFVTPLSLVDVSRADYLLLDRFVSDTLFYEPRRKGFSPIGTAFATTVESLLLSISNRVDIVLIEKQWDDELIERHTDELLDQFPSCSRYWLSLNLEARRTEHIAYYEHTKRFLQSQTAVHPTCIHYTDDFIRSVFDVPGMEVIDSSR